MWLRCRHLPKQCPDGPRALYVNDDVRNVPVTTLLDEHAIRSDGAVGLCARLHTAWLLADREAGMIAPEDARLLEEPGLLGCRIRRYGLKVFRR